MSLPVPLFAGRIFVCSVIWVGGKLFAQEPTPTRPPLSPFEAVQLVSLEEEAKQAFAAEQQERLDARPALDRSVLDLGERKIFYNRTAPAAPRIRPAPSQAADVVDLADEVPEVPSKPQVFLMFSATVFERGVTELRWQQEGRDYQAWSPIDFNYFTGIGDFETAAASYHYFMSIGNEEHAAAADPRVAMPSHRKSDSSALIRRPAGYLVTASPAGLKAAPAESDEAAFALLDALHLYYAANEDELQAAYQRRQMLDAAREAYHREHPPAPRDTVINFAPFMPAPPTSR